MTGSLENIKLAFENAKKNQKGAFIPFFTIGDPDAETFLKLMDEVADHADIIELGIPFSDPLADGPTIQKANERARSAGTNLSQCFDLIKKAKAKTGKPIVLLTYANIVGSDDVRKDVLEGFAESGVDGIIIADVPIEEAEPFRRDIEKHGLGFIQLVTPNTSPQRLRHIMNIASGFLYLVAVSGVTGARSEVLDETRTVLRSIHLSGHNRLPICVGFGISKPEHVREIIKLGANGAIVGSAIIRIIEENLKSVNDMAEKIEAFVSQMSSAAKNGGE